MPEPDDDLFATFRTGGTAVDPMPAAEVRRRGDRLRRRNHALTSLGGVAAAVLLVGTPLAVLGSGDDDAPRPPVATDLADPGDPRWREEIPDSLDLTPGLPEVDGRTGAPVETTDASGVDDLAFCGEPAWSPTSPAPVPAVDVAGARYVGASEDREGRTLALYDDGQGAAAAADAIRSAVGACPEDGNGPGNTLVNEVRESDLAGDDAFVVVQQARDGDGLEYDLSVWQVVRTGNALLVTHAFTAAGGPQVVEETLGMQAREVAPVLDAMAVFAAGAPDGAPTSEPAAAGPTIPDGFDLLAGYPTRSEGGEHGRRGPSRDLAPLVPEACGVRAEVPAHADLLRAGYSNPEDRRERQLVTFADAAAAEAYLQSVLAVHRDCLEVEQGDERQLTQVIDSVSGVGDSAGGAITRYELFGAPAPGLTALVVVRVDRAVLLATATDERGAGEDPGAAVQQAFNDLLAQSSGVIDQMRGL